MRECDNPGAYFSGRLPDELGNIIVSSLIVDLGSKAGVSLLPPLDSLRSKVTSFISNKATMRFFQVLAAAGLAVSVALVVPHNLPVRSRVRSGESPTNVFFLPPQRRSTLVDE